MPIRVVLGEDSYLAREAITGVLERAEGVEVVAACADLPTLREAIDDLLPDVVVTDIRMPPSNEDEGMRLATELRTTHPEIGVVVLSHYAESSYAAILFEDGSQRRAYLLKESVKNQADLVRAVQTVREGGSVVDPLIVEQLVAVRQRRQDADLDSLTPKELEILGMIAEGKSNTAIAEELVVTKRAVERHVNSIFMKLRLHDAQNVSRRVKAALLYLAGRRDQ